MELRRRVASPPIIAVPKVGQPYWLEKDASQYRCTLLQRQHDDTWLPVGFFTKTLNFNYCATERECLSIVWRMRQLRPYLEGTLLTVPTDNDAPRWVFNSTDSIGRLARWRLSLLQFDYDIDHNSRWVNSVPVAIYRLLALRASSASTPIETDIPTLSVEERANPSCMHSTVLMTSMADVQRPNIMEPDLRSQASVRDYARDQKVPEYDEVNEDEAAFDVFQFDITRQDDCVPEPEDLPSPPTPR